MEQRPANKSLESKITLARTAVGFERIWAALHWPLVVAGFLAAAIVSGLLTLLPEAGRLAILAVAGLLFLGSLRPLFRIVWPGRPEAMRRIEQASHLEHRPVSTHDDQLASATNDGRQLAIWEEHKLRQLKQLQNLKIGNPKSAWRDLDPRALRLPAALAVVAALLLGQGSPSANLSDALSFTPKAEAETLALDAWLTPPAYTGVAPMVLTSPAMVERLKQDNSITVPENSVLRLRVSGAEKPSLRFFDATAADATPVTDITASGKTENGLFQSETKLPRSLRVAVMDGDRELASWRVITTPDKPPSISITGTPAGDASGTLSVDWKAADDYGVTGITSEISLADEQDGGIGFESNGIFLFDPPEFPIAMRKASPREEAGTSSADVAEHPWAGFMVELTLTAKDAAGHQTGSESKTFRLPERLFLKPLAKVLIEQRKRLILKPEQSGSVEQMLDALLTYPKGLIEKSGDHIAIAAIAGRLRAAANQDDVDSAISMLWETAVGIEDGTLADARAELEALRKELERALAEGAPQEKIAELMDKMRQAMDRYLQSMMEETQKQMQQGKLDPRQQMQQGQSISPEDLQRMLDTIEKLSQSGANDAARQMLSQLDQILRNMKPGMQGQMQGQQNSPLSQMLDQLSELMRRQQGLMDDTQRMQQPGEQGDQQMGQQGDQGQKGQGFSPEGLAQQQGDLYGMLQEMMRQLGQNGMAAPPSLGDAGKSMKEAQGSLGEPDREGALTQQGEALSKLREGARGLAQQMMQQSQGAQGSYGRQGEARGDDRDPLGRPMPSRSEDTGPEQDMLPSELAVRKAREILEMLRSRISEPELPKIDRDYIDRLLRGLY